MTIPFIPCGLPFSGKTALARRLHERARVSVPVEVANGPRPRRERSRLRAHSGIRDQRPWKPVAQGFLALFTILIATVVGGCAYRVGPSARAVPIYLTQLKMVSLNSGWAVGSNAAVPTGTDGANPEWILRTGTSGRSWGPVLAVPVGSRAAFLNASDAWVAEPSNSGIINILSTENAGLSWQRMGVVRISGKDPQAPKVAPSMDFIDSKHGWLYTCGGPLFVTDDGGKSWVPGAGLVGQTCDPGSSPISLMTGVSYGNPMDGMGVGPIFTSPYVGWAVNHGQLFETTGGGFGWARVNLARKVMAAFPMISGVSVLALAASRHDVVVYLSTIPSKPQKMASQTTSARSQRPAPNCLPASVPTTPASTRPVWPTANVADCLAFECSFFAVSQDAGRHWRFGAPLGFFDPPVVFAQNPLVALGNAAPPRLRSSTGPPRLRPLYTSDDGAIQWRAVGIPQFQGVQVHEYRVVDVLNPQIAWALVRLAPSQGQACPPARLFALMRTVDGGKQWSLMDNNVAVGG